MNRGEFKPDFFNRPVLTVARELLGATLETRVNGKITSGVIVEVEAYHQSEAAAHSHRGKTKRAEIMFGPGGYCYVYFIYGMHYCVNVVAEAVGVGAAVLIRAIEPVGGVETMERRRKMRGHALTNGPAKLCQALAIDKKMLGENFLSSAKIHLKPAQKKPSIEIETGPRIGISQAKDLPWRLWVRDNPWVSRG